MNEGSQEWVQEQLVPHNFTLRLIDGVDPPSLDIEKSASIQDVSFRILESQNAW